ncbi:DUF6782 family putative metallopeptidase [Actibacterium pelagium]|uniref:DUF6782 domain-containing protein n=1 Tax=Actibacterium pelagium TaxID=2029103 RepID=A0A917AFY0_9RHOB|nr:DUF6782 family putative metallopeptidase [Actibacterium pelagium]GGE49847.1 hypothetical protein GCM10011517_17010 [Actibacterium pelagium]
MRFTLAILVSLATSVGAKEICISHPYTTMPTAAHREIVSIFRGVAPTLKRFPSLETAVSNMTPELCLSDQMHNAHAYLDVDKNRIVISQRLNTSMQIGVLLHEIRHLEQLAIGACPSEDLAMKEYARATFAMEADASAISLLVAWNMANHGNDRVWAALSAWPTQKDIAVRFEEEMTKSGDLAAATTAAFDQWYRSPDRRESYYLSACHQYLDRIDESHALPRYNLLPEGFLEDLCVLPDGKGYSCSAPTRALREPATSSKN